MEKNKAKNPTNKDSMMRIQLIIFRGILLLLLFKSNKNFWKYFYSVS